MNTRNMVKYTCTENMTDFRNNFKHFWSGIKVILQNTCGTEYVQILIFLFGFVQIQYSSNYIPICYKSDMLKKAQKMLLNGLTTWDEDRNRSDNILLSGDLQGLDTNLAIWSTLDGYETVTAHKTGPYISIESSWSQESSICDYRFGGVRYCWPLLSL